MTEDHDEYDDVEFEYWWREVKDDILPFELELWKSRSKSFVSDEALIDYIKGIYRKWWAEEQRKELVLQKIREEREKTT